MPFFGTELTGSRFASLVTMLKQVGRQATAVAARAIKPSRWLEASRWWYMPATIPSGHVNPQTALTYSGVIACLKAIAEPIATLPVKEYILEGTPERHGRRAIESDVHYLWSVQANPETSAYDFRQALVSSAVFWGAGYAEIERDGADRPVWMWQLPSEFVTPKRDPNTLELVYEYNDGLRAPTLLPARNVFHLRGLSFDGVNGLGLIQLAQRSIALGIALETFGLTFFANNAIPGGVLEAPTGTRMDPEAIKRLIADFYAVHGGANRSNRVAFLPEGIAYKPITLPLNNAQFVEARKSQLEELARWCGVPLHRIGLMDRATWDNVEQENLQFVSYTIVQWITRLEQEIALKLYGRNQRGRRFLKFNVEGLLRGDIKSRYEAYSQGIHAGFLTRNEVRDSENLDPLEYLDEPLAPVNLTTAERIVEGPEEPEAEPMAESEPEAPEPEDDEDDTDEDAEQDSDAALAQDSALALASALASTLVEDRYNALWNQTQVQTQAQAALASQQAALASQQAALATRLDTLMVAPAAPAAPVNVTFGPFTFHPVSPDVNVYMEPSTFHVEPTHVHIESPTVHNEPAVVNVAPAVVNVAPTEVHSPVTFTVEPQAAIVNVDVQSADVQPATINVEPHIYVEPAAINVEPPTVHIAPAEVAVHVEAPTVNMEPPAVHVAPAEVAVHVDAPTINMEPPAVHVEPPAVNVAPAVVNVAPAVVNTPVAVHVEAPTVNMEPPAVHVAPAEVTVHVAPTTVNVDAPTVNVEAASYEPLIEVHNEVPVPVVHVEAPHVAVAAPPAPDVFVQVSSDD